LKPGAFSPEPAPAADPFERPGTESTFHVADYLAILSRRWPAIAVVTLLAVAAFAVRYALTPREYRAETQIQIERRSLSSLTSTQSGINPWLESWWNLEYYPTQYRLLQSRGLAEMVVRNLRLYDDVDFNPGHASPGSTAAAGASAPTAADDEAAVGGLAMRLLGGLEVNPVPNTQLVVIAYRSGKPRLAAAIANGFADAFIEWGIETRAQTVGKASDFLAKQIDALKREISEKDAALRNLSRASAFISLDRNSSVIVERVTALNQDLMEAKGERIAREARYNELAATPKETLADSLSGGLVGQLRGELLQLEQEYATKLNTYKPEYPLMQDLKARIDQQRRNLAAVIEETAAKARDTARAEYQTALRKEQALGREIDATKQENLEQNSAALDYKNLEVELETRQALLNDLLRKQSETDVTGRLQETRESNVRVVDRALMPGGPFRPSLKRELSLGLMLGLVAGIGLVLLIEFLDRTIKDPEQMEKLLGLPTLAVVPDLAEESRGYGYGYGYGLRRKGGRGRRGGRWLEKKTAKEMKIELLPQTEPHQATAEAYRSLRTALLLSTAEELKVVSVTSAGEGEGKTSTATNLAVVLAQLGRRVLLVDGDLRKPRLHEIFKVSRKREDRPGLVSLLTGGGTGEEVYVKTVVPNLYLIPSGPKTPNPAELLASDRMRDLVRHLRSHFDFVVLDSPPALAVTDATLLGSLADGVLLCFAAGRILREEARACRERLLRAEVRVLGTVLNRYRARQTRYGKRYHRYADYAPAAAEAAAKDSAA
jgi:capsular exopolysaccharide synthesis family protein